MQSVQVGGIDAWAVVHAPAYVLAPLWDARRGDVISVPGVIQVRALWSSVQARGHD